jgi:Sep-tRNA:Cys-tRNA synthetase
MNLENPYKGYIVINALMRGGVIPKEVKEKLLEWSDVGYINCFDCLEGRSSLINKPPIKKFLADLAEFFGGDVAEHTFGCRGAQYAVMRMIREFAEESSDYCSTIIVDPNSHYSTNIAAEMNGFRVVEPPHSGYPEYLYSPRDFEEKIKEVKNKKGKLPSLLVVTHADPYYGNIAPIEEIGKICEKYEVPYLVNAAYTGGILPINMRESKIDFLTLSAHKSMMSAAPLGYVITNYKWAKRLFSTSKDRPSWSGRVFGKKIPNIFGCAIGGLPLISSMLSFSYVKERVNLWPKELEKINRFIKEMEDLGDIMLLGERPHRHHLLNFETEKFWEISKNHRKKGFFLAEEMIKRGIVGLHRGMTKHIKFSIYGLTDLELEKVKGAFYEIAKT